MRKTFLSVLSVVALAMAGILVTPDESSALPNFARQTGQPCFSCHFQHIPKLNAYGRSFKMGAYTDTFVDLIEGENLSIPATAPVGFVTKLRYVQTTAKEKSGEKSGTERGEWQIPDEAALWLAGRVSENIGYAIEFPEGWASGKVIFKFPVDAVNVGLSVYSTDALGPAFGMEPFNTGVLRSVRMFESRKETIIAQKIGTGAGAATGLTLYVGSDMFFVGAGLWGPQFGGAAPIDTGFDLSTWYRAAFTPSFGDHNLMIGLFGVSGETKCVECLGGDGSKVLSAKTDSFGVDAQLQSVLGNGMTLEVQGMYLTAGTDDANSLYKKSDGFSTVAELGFNPVFGVALGYSSYTDKSGSANVDTQATSVAAYANLAQNVSLRPEFTSYSGDGRSNDNQFLLLLLAGF